MDLIVKGCLTPILTYKPTTGRIEPFDPPLKQASNANPWLRRHGLASTDNVFAIGS